MRAEPARQDHEGLRVLDEHRLADEEVAEVHAEVDPRVQVLLERQLDAEADRQAARLLAAPVHRLHRARTTAGDDRPSGSGQRRPDPLRHLVVRRIDCGTGRSEDGDGPRHLGEQAEAFDELALYPQHTPRVGVDPVGRAARVQQPLVGGRRLHLRAAQR